MKKYLNILLLIAMITTYSFAGDIEISTDVGQITHTDGSDTTITIDGSITYLDNALGVTYSSGNVYNYGTITALDYYAINSNGMLGNITNSGTVLSEIDYGINANYMVGNIINEAGGTISAATTIGISAYFMSGSITNSGTISADNHGINSDYMVGNIINEAGGTISTGTSFGVYAYSMSGDITNSGTISAETNSGIYAYYMDGDITNSGTISAGTSYGIYAGYMDGNIINEDNGTISAVYDRGIDANQMTGNIINNGTISAGTNYGIHAYFMKGDVINSGTISAETNSGIYAYSMSGDITNEANGTISAGSNTGISAARMTGNIVNNGTISAEGNIGIDSYSMTGSIVNNGTISAEVGNAIYAYLMVGDIINAAGGTISAGYFGIDSANMTGNIINNGTISAGTSYGIYARSMEGDIINGGTISADTHAIYAQSMDGDIISSGIISAESSYGIYAANMVGNIINNGIISAENNFGIYATNMVGNIINNGTISAGAFAVVAGSTLYNFAGAMIKAGNYTVALINTNDTIFNEGLIWATEEAGIAIDNSGYEILNIIGDGEIIGIIDSDSGSNTIIPGSILNIQSTLSGADLDQAFITDWETVNFSGAGIIQLQAGAFTSSTDVNIISGGIAFGGDTTVNTLNITTGTLRTSIDVDAGSAFTLTVVDTSNSKIYSGTNLDIIINGIWKEGVSVTDYRIFIGDMSLANADNFNLTYSPGYSGIWDSTYEWLTLSFYTIPFAEKANAYQTGFAKLMDTIGGYHTEEEIEDLLAEYDFSGYASIVHSQINSLNQRTSSLYNRLNTYESASLQSNNSAMATANRPIRDANGNAIWFDIYSYDGSLDGEDSNNLDYDGYEVAIGFDHALNDNMIIGLSFHYNENSGDVGAVSYDSEGYGLDLYAQYQQGQLTHKMLLGVTNYNNDATRIGATVDFDSDEFYLAYRGEYTISMSSFDLVPVFGLRYAQVSVGSIKDNNDYGLKGYDYTSIQSELGVKLVKELKKAHLWGGVSWLQELGDTDVDAKGSSEFGNFDQKGLEADETIIRASIGLDYQITDSISLGLEYSKEFGDNTDVNAIDAKLSFNF